MLMKVELAAGAIIAVGVLGIDGCMVRNTTLAGEQAVVEGKDPAKANQPRADSQEPIAERVDQFGDPLLAGAMARLGTMRFRCGRVAFSPNEKWLAVQQDGIHL